LSGAEDFMPATDPRARRLFVHAADPVALLHELRRGAFVATRLASTLAIGEHIILGIYAEESLGMVELPVVVTSRRFEANSSVGVLVTLDVPAAVAAAA
jgi:hypothetical protein